MMYDNTMVAGSHDAFSVVGIAVSFNLLQERAHNDSARVSNDNKTPQASFHCRLERAFGQISISLKKKTNDGRNRQQETDPNGRRRLSPSVWRRKIASSAGEPSAYDAMARVRQAAATVGGSLPPRQLCGAQAPVSTDSKSACERAPWSKSHVKRVDASNAKAST
ncbi:hypothetical protein PINS_up005391 [Pythium insidiosum]|nr:hypothetical protein PINS_up005391 [Pythium insidiosum]